jgi:hypothetical protein
VIKNSKNVVIQQILEKMPPYKAWFSCEEKPLANNKEAAPWHDMQGGSGDILLIYNLWASIFWFERSIKQPFQPLMKASSPISLPARSCFLKSAIYEFKYFADCPGI